VALCLTGERLHQYYRKPDTQILIVHITKGYRLAVVPTEDSDDEYKRVGFVELAMRWDFDEEHGSVEGPLSSFSLYRFSTSSQSYFHRSASQVLLAN
jgi:hypothetical protein